MNKNQKIIVDEIKKWQKNNLLPDTYCQFLLQLYTEGERENNLEGKSAPSLFAHAKKTINIFVVMSAFLISIILVIYFTQLSPQIQIGILNGLLFFSLLGVRYFHLKRSSFSHLYVILASFMSLITTILVVDLYFPGHHVVLVTAIVLLCVSWVWVGRRFRYLYLSIAGGCGILLFIMLLIIRSV